MSETVISVEHLSKSYRLGQIGTGTLTNDLKVWWAKVRGRPNPLLRIGQQDRSARPSSPGPSSTKNDAPSDGGLRGQRRTMNELPSATKDETTTDVGRRRTKDEGLGRDGDTVWALKDVSFEVKQGEVLGIIGRNGAGKSTILKILSRITAPTEGEIKVKGRIASLLEVGTGFHPELTGRENTYLNGAILGMTKAEVARKFDEIVAFSEVEQFIDTPVKRYSSGMYVRLAFAVAAHLDPEILLVDEVLAVGDAAFQRKCLGKMGDVARGGRTVLFVSHNMVAVNKLCGRAMRLEEGRLADIGDTRTVVSDYLRTAPSTLAEQSWPDMLLAPGNERVRLRGVRARPLTGSPTAPIDTDTPLVLELEYWNLKPDSCLNLGLHVYNEEGVMIFNTAPLEEVIWHGRPFPRGLFGSRCYIPGGLLNSGSHHVELLVVQDQGVVIYRHEDVLVFDVLDTGEGRGNWHGRWRGAVRPRLRWTTELMDGEAAAKDAASDL